MIKAHFANHAAQDDGIGMVLEFAQHGDLYKWYRSTSYSLSQSVSFAMHISKAIARGSKQLCSHIAQTIFSDSRSDFVLIFFPTDMHSFPAPIIHRDLKSLNVLIGEGAGGAMVAKVRTSVPPFARAGD